MRNSSPSQLDLDFFSPTADESLAPYPETALPKGWAWERLSDLAPVSSEKYQPCNKQEFYIGFEHVEKDTGRILPEARVEPISTIKNRFHAGDILYGKLRPYLNKVAVAPCDGVCSTDMLVLRPMSLVETRYLHWFMLSRGFVNETSANTTGVNLPRVGTKFIENYPVPTPPLPEQTRLVARLETLLGEVDTATAHLLEAQQRLKTYRQAVPHYFLKNEEWERVKLGTVISSMQYGTSDKAEFDDSGIPILRMGNIQNGQLDFGNLKYFNPRHPEVDKYLLAAGDVLFNRTNSAELVGKTAVFKETFPPSIFASYLIRLRMEETSCLPDFFNFYMNSTFGKAFIKSVVSQNVGQANVNGTKLKRFEIPLPDLATQRQTVLEIETRLSAAEAMETAVAEGLRQAETLRQGILKRAFSGQL